VSVGSDVHGRVDDHSGYPQRPGALASDVTRDVTRDDGEEVAQGSGDADLTEDVAQRPRATGRAESVTVPACSETQRTIAPDPYREPRRVDARRHTAREFGDERDHPSTDVGRHDAHPGRRVDVRPAGRDIEQYGIPGITRAGRCEHVPAALDTRVQRTGERRPPPVRRDEQSLDRRGLGRIPKRQPQDTACERDGQVAQRATGDHRDRAEGDERKGRPQLVDQPVEQLGLVTSDRGEPGERTDRVGPQTGERGQDLAAQPDAGDGEVVVHRVMSGRAQRCPVQRCGSLREQKVRGPVEVVPTDVEKWTQPSTGGHRHAGQPFDAGPPSDAEQQRLRLILRMMAVQDEGDAAAVRLPLEGGMTDVPRIRLDPTTGSDDADVEHDMVGVDQLGERSDMGRVSRVVLLAAQTMRDVGEGQPEVGTRMADEERERRGVRATGAGDDRVTAALEPSEVVRDAGDDAREVDARRERAEQVSLGGGGQRRTGALLRPGRSTARQ
jgi:hypothetical protein